MNIPLLILLGLRINLPFKPPFHQYRNIMTQNIVNITKLFSITISSLLTLTKDDFFSTLPIYEKSFAVNNGKSRSRRLLALCIMGV